MALNKITEIVWLLNSPYGTYSSGDTVQIYWNTTTEAINVYKNSVQITGGEQIPFKFKYNSKTDDKYKREAFFDLLICSGTDKLSWQRIDLFPYFVTIRYQNHPSCAVVPVSCDLVFDNLPIVTNASSDTASDGSITVQASSSYPIKYKLNQNFVYEDTQSGTSGQTSGTFTGLPKGDYIIYARDSHNCYTRISVTVGVTVTYGVRWRLEYYHKQQTRSLFYHKTEILQKGYTGDVQIVKGDGDNPTVFEMRGGEGNLEKFRITLPTQMTFKLMNETFGQFSDIYTNDPEKFRLRHTIDGTVVWLGKVLTNQYTEQYTARPNGVEIIANDGLPLLDKIHFADASGNRLSGKYSIIDVIALILKKINLGLSIRCACNLYADTMSTGATNDPLDQAYIDLDRFYLNGDSATCKDVLNKILDPFGAQLIQYGGYWNILRVEERVSTFNYRIFDADGVYVSNGTYQSLKYLRRSGRGDLTWSDANQFLRLNPGFGEIRLIYDLGRRNSILKNEDFRPLQTINEWFAGIFPDQATQSFIRPDLTGWTLVTNSGSAYASPSITEDENGVKNYRLRVSNNRSGNYMLSDTYFLKMAPNHKLKLYVKFTINANTLPRKIRVQVTYGDYYLAGDGNWSNVDSKIIYFVEKDKQNQEHTIEVTAPPPAISYINGANINVKVFFPAYDDYDFTTIAQLRAVPVLYTGYPEFIKYRLPEGTRKDVLLSTSDKPIYRYKLTQSTASEDSLFNLVRPDDYNPNSATAYQPLQWVLDERLEVYNQISQEASAFNVIMSIEKIQLSLLVDDKQPPKESYYNQDMENENPEILTRVIFFGSLLENLNEPIYYNTVNYDYATYNYSFQGNGIIGALGQDIPVTLHITPQRQFYQPVLMSATDIIYTSFLRSSSGTGYTTWFRSSRSESKFLHEIYMDMYSAQYNQAWRTLSGNIYGDVLFSPLDTLVETLDSNRKYYPMSLTINYKQNLYETELFELISTADADVNLPENTPLGPGFTTGFSIGFDS